MAIVSIVARSGVDHLRRGLRCNKKLLLKWYYGLKSKACPPFRSLILLVRPIGSLLVANDLRKEQARVVLKEFINLDTYNSK